jgi:hypothetical protein
LGRGGKSTPPGVPDKVGLRSIDREVSAMTQFLDERVRAELAMWKPKSPVEGWYERNKFWMWVIGIVLSIVGLWAKFG